MKKLLIMLALAGASLTSMAQDAETTEKYSVATNSFWSNWFVQGGAQWAAFYTSGEHGQGNPKSPFKSFHSNPQASIALGKWFTPGLGLRTKVSGIWGKANCKSFKYWNAQEQALFNLSNMFCGYNPKRIWNAIPFIGAGVARNMTSDHYAVGVSLGLLNEFKVSDRVAINLELGWNSMEKDFISGPTDKGNHFWEAHDNILYAEVGLSVNIGKKRWNKLPDVEAITSLSQSQIDALNAQLADANAENDRLRNMLDNQKTTETKSVKEVVTTPVSVFFNCGKAKVANRKDLVNMKSIADYAKENNSTILVTGYADDATGSKETNQKLSERRANTVKDELVKMGVNSDNIKTKANGGVNTLSPNSYNRRATVEIGE